MTYLISIKTAIIVFPFLALIFTFPFILHEYHKYGSINPYRVLIIYSFILYMITLYFLVILPLPNKNEVVAKPNMVRLIPFNFVTDFKNQTSLVINNPSTYLKALREPCFYTVFFNLLMTIPFGVYLRYYFRCSFKKTIILSFFLSLFFELTQITGLYFVYPYPYRVFDVDDLIINTLGGAIGFWIVGAFMKFLPTREEIDAEALRNSEVVSGLRRIVMFILDCFIFLFIYTFASIFIRGKYLLLSLFIVYYIVFSYLMNGTTLGSKFLNIRLEFKKYKLLNITIRIIFLFVYYFGIPYLILYTNYLLELIFNLTLKTDFFVYILIILVILLFYIVNMIILLKNKKIFYDKWFQVSYVNTIKIREEEKN